MIPNEFRIKMTSALTQFIKPLTAIIFEYCGKEDLPVLEQTDPDHTLPAASIARTSILQAKKEEFRSFTLLIREIEKKLSFLPKPAKPPLWPLPVDSQLALPSATSSETPQAVFLKQWSAIENHTQILRFDTAIALRSLKSHVLIQIRDVQQPALVKIVDHALEYQFKELAFLEDDSPTADSPCIERECRKERCPQKNVVTFTPAPTKPEGFATDILYPLPLHLMNNIRNEGDLVSLITKSGGKLRIKMAHEKWRQKCPSLPLAGALEPTVLDFNTENPST
jgi:hypothetical protein